MVNLAQIDLGKIAASAQAATTLIIANSIFLQQVTTKSIAVHQTYRSMTAEIRHEDQAAGRDRGLKEQVEIYRWRCHQIRRATRLLNISEISFLISVVTATLDVAIPGQPIVRVIGALSMMVGLVLIAWSAVMEIQENNRLKEAIDSEQADIPTGRPVPAHR